MSDESIISLPKQQSDIKDKLLYVLKISFTFLVVYILVKSINSDQLIASFKNANYILMFIAVLLGILNIYLQFYKWKIICVNSLNETENKKIWYSLLHGFAAAVVTPFRIGEYAGRALALRNSDAVKVTVATLADKFFSLMVILVAGSGAALIYLRLFGYINNTIYLPLIAIEVGIIFSAKWIISNGGILKLRTISQLQNIKVLEGILKKADAFKGFNKKLKFRLVLFSLLAFLSYTTQYSFFVSALANHWSLHLYLLCGILTIFTKTLIPPFTLGELGIREGASVFFITQIGLPAAVGFNASILLFLLNIAIPGLIGGILLLKRV